MSNSSDTRKKLIVVTAPSGSGKSTIVKHLIKSFDSLAFSVSATTREKRPDEKHGRHYYYVSLETFHIWVAEDAFVEWEEVYDNQFYGTPKFEIERLWGMGKHVIFDIDVKGALNIKKKYPDEAVVIFVKVPSIDVLVDRLKARQTETEQSLQKRIGRIEEEMSYSNAFDYVLLNDELETALENAEEILRKVIAQ